MSAGATGRRRPASSRSAAGTGWPRRCRAAAASTDRPHRGGHGRPTTAAPPAGCAASSACCRPATCGWRWPRCATTTSGADLWRDVLQHRFAGDGALGRPRGRQPADRRAVGAARRPGRRRWTWVGRLLGARGRVLPMAAEPLDIEAERAGRRPGTTRRAVTGPRARSQVATTPGRVSAVRLDPPDPPACPRRSRRSMRPTGSSSGPAPGSPA